MQPAPSASVSLCCMLSGDTRSAAQAKEDFTTMLEESDELPEGTRWSSKVARLFDLDPRWKVGSSRQQAATLASPCCSSSQSWPASPGCMAHAWPSTVLSVM